MTQEEKFYREVTQSLTIFTTACAFIVVVFALAEFLV